MKINYKYFFKAICAILAYMLIIPNFVLLILTFFNLDLTNNFNYAMANLLIYALSFIYLYLLYQNSLKEEANKYFKSFKKNFKIGIKYWLQGFCFMIISNMLVMLIAGDIATNEEANRTLMQTMPLFSFVSMAFLGPILEEILFRHSFKKVFQNENVFCIVTSLLFGSAHLVASFTLGSITSNPYQLLYIIPYSGIGYFLAKSYSKTDTVFTSIGSHMIHNTISVLVVLLAGV